MAVPFYKAIPGAFVVVGKAPDGDSVRFIADDTGHFDDLHRSFRIKPARSDQSVQLRFEAVDTPEVHYGSAAQPLGTEARDKMLARLGFTQVTFNANETATASDPAQVRGLILSKGADANGRPISYVLTQADARGLGLREGEWNHVSAAVLDQTINRFLLEEGHAYYTVYTSTPLEHRQTLRPLAEAARTAGAGLWSTDDTSDFILESQDDIGPQGQLILPKLFRRCTDYLKAKDKGYQGELTDWLVDHSAGSRPENDQVLLDGVQGPVPFSSLISQRNRHIALEVDLFSMTFLEK